MSRPSQTSRSRARLNQRATDSLTHPSTHPAMNATTTAIPVAIGVPPMTSKPPVKMAPRPSLPEPPPLEDWAASAKARSIRMKDGLWNLFAEGARRRGIAEVSSFVRDCAIAGLEYLDTQAAMASHRETTTYDGRHTRR